MCKKLMIMVCIALLGACGADDKEKTSNDSNSDNVVKEQKILGDDAKSKCLKAQKNKKQIAYNKMLFHIISKLL